ncbi:hypothetical protein Tco_1391245 [Tanacetum coccineum]
MLEFQIGYVNLEDSTVTYKASVSIPCLRMGQTLVPPSPDYIPRPEVPPSPDYIPGPEVPSSPDYIPGLEEPQSPPPLDFVPEPMYPEYIPQR